MKFFVVITCCTFELALASVPKFEKGDPERFLPWIKEWNSQNTKPWINIDMAYFNIWNNLTTAADLFVLNDQCFGCPLENKARTFPGHVITSMVQSKYANYLEIRKPFNSTAHIELCRDHKHLREHGDYWLILLKSGTRHQCHFLLANNPGNSDLYVLYAVLILAALGILWVLFLKMYRNENIQRRLPWNRYNYDLQPISMNSISTIGSQVSNASPLGKENLASQEKSQTKLKKRVTSLDVFRGFSLAAIIFINYGGGQYWYFQHAYWDGLTAADIFMPWFVFMSGTAMAFSFRSFLNKGKSRRQLFLKVLRRSLLLFAFGIVYNKLWDLKNARIMNVLQRIALSYFITAAGHVIFLKTELNEKCVFPAAADILHYWPEWLLNFLYLAIHTTLTFAFPVPKCPRGYLGPGGMHEGGKYFNCTGGAAGYIDRMILGERHLYQWPTTKTLYKGTQPYDPEGLLGTLTSAFQCFLGLQVGKIIMYHKAAKGRLIRWGLWMLILCALGTLLCQAKQTGGWIPINKNLWSLSFTLVLSGLGFGMIAASYIVIDLMDLWNGAPFIYAGMNSIVIYMGHSFLSSCFPVRWWMESRHDHQLFIALWGTSVWMLAGFFMYKKKFFVAL